MSAVPDATGTSGGLRGAAAGESRPGPPSRVRSTAPAVERPVPFEELGDFTTVDRRTLWLAGLAVPIGIAAALVAALLLGLIGLITNLAYYGRLSWSFASPAGNQLGLLAIGVPIVGGLLVGLMARYGSERIRGHGIPEAIEAILVNKSKIRPKVTVLKPLSAALSIGTGGPFGAEGPIIMTGGSVGSVFGQTLHLSATERKALLVAGAAGGMAATFNTPVAAVLLAVELLLFEWRPRSLLPVGVAAATATLVRWPILGNAPLFPVAASPLPTLSIAGGALLIGVAAGALATILTYAVYAFEDLYRRLPVHWMWWPMIGGLVIGVGGIVDPRVLGVGYSTIDLLLVGGLGIAAAALLLILKGVVWTASLGSGTSGGVLAPLLMMGAATGTLIGFLLPVGSPSLWALIALGAVLGGTMRVPFTGAVFALELTHDLNVLFPLFIACLAAEGLTVFTLRRSILTEKVARRRIHVAREYAVDPLEVVPIKAVMHRDIVPVSAESTVGAVARLAPERTGKFVGFALEDEDRRVVGFVTKEEVARYLSEGGDPEHHIHRIAAPGFGALDPDQPVRVGAAMLARFDREALPVADPADPGRYIGLLTREDLFEARVISLQDEQERDRPVRITFPTLRLNRGPLARTVPPTPRVAPATAEDGPGAPTSPAPPGGESELGPPSPGP